MKKGRRGAGAGAAGKGQALQAGKPRAGAAWVLVVCIGLGFALYGNSLKNEFVFDDLPLIAENPVIKDMGNVWQVLGLTNGEPLYRPVRYVSYMVDYWVWGMNPAGYHAANIVYHGLSGFILYLVLSELLQSGAAALAGAVLFVSHPVVTDSVTYISGRRDILVGLFYLSSFYNFVRYRQRPRGVNAVLAGFFFLMALGSKEMGITLPAVFVLYDFTEQFRRVSAARGMRERVKEAAGELVKRNWKIYVPMGIAAGVFFYNKIFLHYPSLRTSFYGGSAASNFATVVRIVNHYLKLVVMPVALQADYSYNAFALSASFFEWRVAGAGVVVGAVLWQVVRSLKRREWVFFGGMWFFITLLPVSQIFPHHELMAEHYLYVPLAGVMIGVSSLWGELWERRRVAAAVVLIGIVALYSGRTIARNGDWRDGMTLWSGVVAAAPESARGHDNLGTEYFKRKQYREALKHYQEAVRLRPEHAVFHNNAGMAYGACSDLPGARREFEKAIALNKKLGKAYFNLATVCYFEKQYVEAAKLFLQSRAVKQDAQQGMDARRAMAYFSYAQTVLALDEEHFTDFFSSAPILKGLGTYMGRDNFAIYLLQQAISIKPDYVKAYEALAGCYRKKGDTEKALQAQRALEALKPGAAGNW
jgi:protein O-mannosyl-transferase